MKHLFDSRGRHHGAALSRARTLAAARSDRPSADVLSSPWRRRDMLGLALLAAAPYAHATPATRVELWRGPACSCCGDWVKHMEANGFAVTMHDDGNGDARTRLGMPIAYGSCHTALIDGYAIEGHVPAPDVRRLLRERPQAVGLAVPGMRLGSPGMDGPSYGGRRDPYDVMLVKRDGSASVFAAHR